MHLGSAIELGHSSWFLESPFEVGCGDIIQLLLVGGNQSFESLFTGMESLVSGRGSQLPVGGFV